MSTETLKEMEARWALLMAATYSDGRYKGQRVTDVDGKYARETLALRVQIEERRAAENAQPQMSKTQLEQLSWLERARSAKGKDGRLLFFDHSASGSKFRENIQTATSRVLAGQDISATIAKTEQEGGPVPAASPMPARHLLPPAAFHNNQAQPINTYQGEAK